MSVKMMSGDYPTMFCDTPTNRIPPSRWSPFGGEKLLINALCVLEKQFCLLAFMEAKTSIHHHANPVVVVGFFGDKPWGRDCGRGDVV